MAFQLKKVLISDDIDQKCIDILQQNGVNVVKKTKLAKDDLIAELKQDYDGLIVRSATKVTAEVIEACPCLKIIGRAGTGVDNIDCDAATKCGVIVMNTPGGNTMSAAELTCAMIMAVSRHVAQGHESMREGRWDRKKFMGNEVYGKTLAIIGLGRIGKEVALRMQAFGMRTIGFDPIIPASESAKFNTEWLPLEEVWPQADYITVHTPLIPQTRNLINLDVLSRCKKGVRLINVARGGIIDEECIVPAIEKGYCGGAALDVFTEEPPKNQELTKHPLVVCTPHLGASTTEAQTRVAEEIAQQFVDLRDGKSLFGAINAQAVSQALSPATKPWVHCGQTLGTVGVAMTDKIDASSKIRVLTHGCDLKSSGYMSAAVLSGLLRSQSDVDLNLVNAPALAKTLGVKVETAHAESDTNCVEVEITGSSGATRISGRTDGAVVYLTAVNGSSLSHPAALGGTVLIIQGAKSIQDILGNLGTAPTSFSIAGKLGDQSNYCILSLETAVATDKLKTVAARVFQVKL